MTDAPSWPPVTLRPRRVEVTRPGAPTLARHVVALPGAVLNCLFGSGAVLALRAGRGGDLGLENPLHTVIPAATVIASGPSSP